MRRGAAPAGIVGTPSPQSGLERPWGPVTSSFSSASVSISVTVFDMLGLHGRCNAARPPVCVCATNVLRLARAG